MHASRRALLGGGLAAIGAGLLGFGAGARSQSRRRPRQPTDAIAVSTVSFAGTVVDRVRVDLDHARIGLYWQRADGSAFGSLRAVYEWLHEAGERPIALTNAGIFGTTAPVGLHVERGVVRHPLDSGDGVGNFYMQPNGLFLIGATGAQVVATSAVDLGGVQLATQSGPLLLAGGVMHPRFDPASKNALVRSGVGVRSPKEVWFAVTRGPITFWDFARLFRDELGCADALYLDGTISRLYAPSAGRHEDHAFMGVLAALS
jgi:uncharacterized protein YigE (DUF2233 family)